MSLQTPFNMSSPKNLLTKVFHEVRKLLNPIQQFVEIYKN